MLVLDLTFASFSPLCMNIWKLRNFHFYSDETGIIGFKTWFWCIPKCQSIWHQPIVSYVRNPLLPPVPDVSLETIGFEPLTIISPSLHESACDDRFDNISTSWPIKSTWSFFCIFGKLNRPLSMADCIVRRNILLLVLCVGVWYGYLYLSF